jgi:hypothetical protein
MYKVCKIKDNLALEHFKKLMLTEMFYQNISIKDLARLSNVIAYRIEAFKYRNNRPLNLDEIVKIANVLNIDLNKLKGGIEWIV